MTGRALLRTLEVERLGVRAKHALITIGGREEQNHLLALADRLPSDRDVLRAVPRETQNRRRDTKKLVRHHAKRRSRIGPDTRGEERVDAGGDRVGDCRHPGFEEERSCTELAIERFFRGPCSFAAPFEV